MRWMIGRRRTLRFAVSAMGLVLVTSACGSGADQPQTLRVAYPQSAGAQGELADRWYRSVADQFEKQHPGLKVDLVKVKTTNPTDYQTKIQLMQRSPKTAPDVLMEDTFFINADATAGFLKPLDDRVAKWQDWKQFYPATKRGVRGGDGHVYGVPNGTDTRALWYNKTIFKKAGLPVPWQPRDWEDILQAARAIKANTSGVIPLQMNSGKAAGEASTMTTFLMLMHGTEDQVYDSDAAKWVASSKGFEDALGFVQTVFQEGLGPKVGQALNPNWGAVWTGELMPHGKIGIALEGSYLSQAMTLNEKPWKEWPEVLAVAPMPTQSGQPPGVTSTSGGWAMSISANSDSPDLAWKYIQLAMNHDNLLEYEIALGQIAVRKDVAANEKYLQSNPTVKTFTDLLTKTHYRPALAEYPQISVEIQQAMEAVMTGKARPAEATRRYAEAVKRIAGTEKVKGG